MIPGTRMRDATVRRSVVVHLSVSVEELNCIGSNVVISRPQCMVWMVTILGGIFISNNGDAEHPLTRLASVEGKSPMFVQRTIDPHGRVAFWLESSLKRVFPTSPVGDRGSLKLLSARNARLSFQACYRNESTRAGDSRLLHNSSRGNREQQSDASVTYRCGTTRPRFRRKNRMGLVTSPVWFPIPCILKPGR